jgi:redox-sensing transcriptional repressor
MAADRPEPQGKRIPEATVVRLPIYQRILDELLRSGTRTVSSEHLASMARLNAAKVRKDLSLLGSFGTRGTGYDVAFLASQIDRALGADQDWPVAVVGVGNLGRALVNSEGFSSHGFRVAGVFDLDPRLIGQRVGPVEVRHVDRLSETAATVPLAIGVIATPPAAAQEVADLLVGAGVPSILNFAPRILHVPSHVLLRYVDLSIELQVLSFYEQRRSVEPRSVPVLRSLGLGAPAEPDVN